MAAGQADGEVDRVERGGSGATHLRTELDVARRALGVAYERARAVQYRPGSRQMDELGRAEDRYQQARRRHEEALPPPQVIDLREPAPPQERQPQERRVAPAAPGSSRL